MNGNRLRKAQGEDLTGKTIASRTSGINVDFLSPLERGMIAEQIGEDLRGHKGTSARGAEPSKDARVSGSGVAHSGMHGAPTIFYEKPGGRRGGKGKRVGGG